MSSQTLPNTIMNYRVDLHRSIGFELLTRVFSVYFIITLTVTGLHMLMSYLNATNEIDEAFVNLKSVFAPGIAQSLWHEDEEQVQSILKGMLNVPVIKGVKIETPQNEVVSTGGNVLDEQGRLISVDLETGQSRTESQFFLERVIYRKFELVFVEDEEQHEAGFVTLYSDSQFALDQVKYEFLIIFANSIIKTIALWFIVLWFARRLLSIPLGMFASATEQLNLDELGETKIDTKVARENELKILERAFNRMVQKLYLARKGLGETMNALDQANRRLKLLFDSTRKMTTTNDKFNVLIKATDSLLHVLACQSTVQVCLSFRENNLKGTDGFSHFQFPAYRNAEGKLILKTDSLQETKHFFSPGLSFFTDLLHRQTPLSGCLFSENTLNIPFWFEKELIGAIQIQGITALTEEDKSFVDTLSQSIAIFLEDIRANFRLRHTKYELEELNQELENKVEERTAELVHINHVTQAINSTLELEKIMKLVMEILQAIFEFDQIGIFLKDETQQALKLNKYYGKNVTPENFQIAQNLHLPLKDSTSHVCDTLLSNAPVYISPVTSEISKQFFPLDQELYDVYPVKAYLFYPLQVQNQNIGTLVLANTQHSLSLTELDIETIQRYVTQIATAINNASLYEDLRATKVQLAETEKIASMTQTFEKFVPKQFLTRIADEGLENIELGKADSDNITILFSDIRDFTSLSEAMSPQESLNFLNAYLKRMNQVIHDHHGFIDKFIGDAIMALFDQPDQTDADEAFDAIQAAIAMQEAVTIYNQHRSTYGYGPIAIGIGIHSGPVIIGTVGSEDRMDSTVLGDSVNLASRLEGLTKHYGTKIIVSHDTLQLVENFPKYQFRELDWVKVKGKVNPVRIYEIYDGDTPEIQALKSRTKDLLTEGLMHRQAQKWDAAVSCFQAALAIYPDQAIQLQLQRCQELRAQKLSADWDGAVNLDQK